MNEQVVNQKSYNPFKMWGAWVGGVIGALSGKSIAIYNKLYGCQAEIGSFGCTATLNEMLIGALIGLITGFLLGWGIHSLVRKYKK